MYSDRASGTATDITRANLQQHLQNQHHLERQRLESHQLAAKYASLAPPRASQEYMYDTSASSTASYRSDAEARRSFSTDSDSRGELATPEEVPEVRPFASTTSKDVVDLDPFSLHLPNKQQIESLQWQSDLAQHQLELTAQDESPLVLPPRPPPLERFSSSATMTTTRASQEKHEDLPRLDLLDLNAHSSMSSSPPTASWRDSRRDSDSSALLPRTRMSSSDSWRSLLPEHDPYFASHHQLTSHAPSTAASYRSISPASHLSPSHQLPSDSFLRVDRSNLVNDLASTSSNGRSSIGSAPSSSSFTSCSDEPSSADCRVDSWRSTWLSESDSPPPSQAPSTSARPSLPTLSRAFMPADADYLPALAPIDHVARNVAAKRHASFSVVEDNQAKLMMASERDSWPCNRQAPSKQVRQPAASPRPVTPEPTSGPGRRLARLSSCSVTTPQSPCTLPFLDHRPAPLETNLSIETATDKYTLTMSLPGFSLDCITLATKQQHDHRTLHIVADKWDTDAGGHFERRITFPDQHCDLKNVKAEFDGTILRVHVPRT